METKKLYTKEGNELIELIDYRGLYVTPMTFDNLIFSKERFPDSVGLVIDQSINKLTLLMFEHGSCTWYDQDVFLENIQNKGLIPKVYNPKYYIPKRWEILKNIEDIRNNLNLDGTAWTSEEKNPLYAWIVYLASGATGGVNYYAKNGTNAMLAFVEIDV